MLTRSKRSRARTLTPLLLAALISQAHAVDVTQIGASGTNGTFGIPPWQAGTAGSAGGSANATAAASLDAINRATALGGSGGNGGSGAMGTANMRGGWAGAGGAGGNATAVVSGAPIDSDAYGYATANAGSGGTAGLPGFDGGYGMGTPASGGNGGAASASGVLSGFRRARLDVMAVAGNGGAASGLFSYSGNGGDANAHSDATARTDADSLATSYAGTGDIAGRAKSRAIARTTEAGGQSYAAASSNSKRYATAIANADAYAIGNGTADASAYISTELQGFGTAHSHSTGALGRTIVTGSDMEAQGFGIAGTKSTFGAGGFYTKFDLASAPKRNGINAFSFADGEPPASQVQDELGAHTQVAAALAPAGLQVAGIGVMGATAQTFAGTFSADARYTFTLAGTSSIVVGLLDFSGYDGGSPLSIEFSISNFDSVLLDETFTTVAAAGAYFTDHALALGSFSGDVDLLISFKMKSTTIQAAGFSYLVATGPFAAAAVPEPESLALLLAGLGVLGFVSRRKAAAKH